MRKVLQWKAENSASDRELAEEEWFLNLPGEDACRLLGSM